MGSIFRVPFFVTEDLHETIQQLQNAQISVYGAHLEGSVCYDTPDYTKGTAFLIFGNGGNGLTKETASTRRHLHPYSDGWSDENP